MLQIFSCNPVLPFKYSGLCVSFVLGAEKSHPFKPEAKFGEEDRALYTMEICLETRNANFTIETKSKNS
jgi:hypothetical protein